MSNIEQGMSNGEGPSAQEKESRRPDPREEALTPLVQKLKGALAGSDVAQEDYYAYLEEKYLKK